MSGTTNSLIAYSRFLMQMRKSSTPAAAAAQAVKTAACPSVRFCSRHKIQQQALNRRSRAQHRSQRHLVRALEAEAEGEEPSTHKKRGRKKNTKPHLPSVRRPAQQTSCPFTSCRPLHEQLVFAASFISANNQKFICTWGPWSAHGRIRYKLCATERMTTRAFACMR